MAVRFAVCALAGFLAVSSALLAQPVLQQPFVGARVGAALAYDTARNELVLFGGSQDLTAATWRRNGSGWSALDQTAVPTRVGARMVFDAGRQRAVMFGGAVGNVATSDLYEWDGAAWSRRNVSGPRAQTDVGLAYDSGRGRTVLFDGQTWEWDGTNWLLRATTGPVARAGAALAYDPVRQRTVLFGGNVDPEAFAGTTDTWEWDGTTWRQIQVLGPSARGYTSMAYSPASGRVVLFGGTSGLTRQALLADTWEFDGVTWAQRTSGNVPARSRHGMAWDTRLQRVVMFGGDTASGPSSELWSWDGTAWTSIEAGPPASYVVGRMVYDEARDETLYYGGTNPTSQVALGETWTWNGSTWRRHQPAIVPPPRHVPALAWDSNRRRVLLVGGAIGDHWEWDGTSWQQFAGATPPSRLGGVMAFDPSRNRMVLFGGFAGSAYVDETWEFDGLAWRLMAPASRPPARSHAQMTWDPNTGGIILFGGVENGSNALADTWRYAGGTWTRLTPATSPAARVSGVLLTDTARGRCVLAGGGGYAALLPFELWDWDGSNWSLRLSESRLRTQAHAAFDSRRGHVVVQEGNNTSQFVEFAFMTDVAGRGSARLTASVARPGGSLQFDTGLAGASFLMLAAAPRLAPAQPLTGAPFCATELLFVPAAASVGVSFVGPSIAVPVPNSPSLAWQALVAQAAVVPTGACVALTDALLVRIQPR